LFRVRETGVHKVRDEKRVHSHGLADNEV